MLFFLSATLHLLALLIVPADAGPITNNLAPRALDVELCTPVCRPRDLGGARLGSSSVQQGVLTCHYPGKKQACDYQAVCRHAVTTLE